MPINVAKLKQRARDTWDNPEQRAKLIGRGLKGLTAVGAGVVAVVAQPPVTWRQRSIWVKSLDIGTAAARVVWRPVDGGIGAAGGWLISTTNDVIRRKVSSPVGRFALVAILSLTARPAIDAGAGLVKKQALLQKLDQYGLAGWLERKATA